MMRDYGVSDYGLVLGEYMMQILASKLCENYTQEAYDRDSFPFKDEVMSKLDIEYIGEFTGDAFCLDDDGNERYGGTDTYCGDQIFYIPLMSSPRLIGSAYGSMDDVVSELLLRVGDYIPGGYDIRSGIRHIVGTYFG